MAYWGMRADLTPLQAEANTRRNYRVRYFEASSGAALQTLMNAALLSINTLPPKTTIHLCDIQYAITGTGANTKYTALATVFFTGFEEVTIWS
jgi:hypothetical protein